MTYIKLKGISPNSSELAKHLLDEGYAIFPAGKDKKPLNGYKWGDHPITSHSEAETRWNETSKRFAIGVITGQQSNLLVLDVDNKNGSNGSKSLEKLENDYGSLPETFKVKTPTGGFHYYFKYGECDLTVDAGIVDGIDYRGEGGYVISAGSHTKDGSYEVVCNSSVADTPAWLIDVLKRDKSVATNNKVSEKSSKFLSSGSRNNDLTSLAGSMRRKGMDQDSIETSLLAVNQTLDDPLLEHEVSAIAKSIAKYPASEVSVYATEQDFAEYLAQTLEGKIRYVEGLRFLTNKNL